MPKLEKKKNLKSKYLSFNQYENPVRISQIYNALNIKQPWKEKAVSYICDRIYITRRWHFKWAYFSSVLLTACITRSLCYICFLSSGFFLLESRQLKIGNKNFTYAQEKKRKKDVRKRLKNVNGIDMMLGCWLVGGQKMSNWKLDLLFHRNKNSAIVSS